jgi:hypothetical protein
MPSNVVPRVVAAQSQNPKSRNWFLPGRRPRPTGQAVSSGAADGAAMTFRGRSPRRKTQTELGHIRFLSEL